MALGGLLAATDRRYRLMPRRHTQRTYETGDAGTLPAVGAAAQEVPVVATRAGPAGEAGR